MAPLMLSDAPAPESHVATIPVTGKCVVAAELEVAACDCCGLQEECTPEYVLMVRERFHGKWICGLCAEAVKDEAYRSNRLIGTEEALNLHMNFCKNFRSSDPATHLISAVRQLLRRSLEGPRTLGSAPSSPVAKGRVRPVALRELRPDVRSVMMKQRKGKNKSSADVQAHIPHSVFHPFILQ